MRVSRLIKWFSLLTLMPTMAFGAETPLLPELMQEELLFLQEETVSIAAMHEQPISEAPSNVYVITQEDIRHSGATDIPTLLRRIPGMEVIQMSGADFNVSARGDNQPAANKLLVLIDGRSVYEDTLGLVYWKALPITLPEIAKIEVLKGPASALYGFNAFDGVINIITKSPDDYQGTIVQFGGGEFGTISAAAVNAAKYGDFGYRLSLGRDQNQQWRNRDTLAFRSHKLNLHTQYRTTPDSMISLSGGFVDVNRFDGFVTSVVTEASTLKNGYVNALFKMNNFSIRGSYTRWEPTSLETINPLLSSFLVLADRHGDPEQELRRNQYDLEAQHALNFGSHDKLTYGINFRHNTASSNFLQGSPHENRLGFYVQNEWQPDSPITVITGVRMDLHTQIDPTYSPRIALIYKFDPDHSLRLSASWAYRPPTIFETHLESHGTFFPLGCPPNCFLAFPNVLNGSENLKPEKIASYEVSYQGWYLKHRLRFRGSFFYNHVSNLIGQVLAANGTDLLFKNNTGFADIYGVEAGLEFLFTSWLSGFTNYTFQEFSQSFSQEPEKRGSSRHKINAGLRGEWSNGLNGEIVFHYAGSSEYPINSSLASLGMLSSHIGTYTLLNIRGGYLFWKDKAEIAVSAFNALNDHHREHPLGDIIRSRVMGWLTLKF